MTEKEACLRAAQHAVTEYLQICKKKPTSCLVTTSDGISLTDLKIVKYNDVVTLLSELIEEEGKKSRGSTKAIKRLIAYFKRPKCKNGHRCADCIHSDAHWDDLRFRGFTCRINAR